MEQSKLELLVLEVLGEVKGMRVEIDTINQRLGSLEQGQEELRQEMRQGQEEIKQYIKSNNVAIAEIMTQALENHDKKTKETYITKSDLIRIAK